MTVVSTARKTARVTWRHLLQNTSEWEGELFGKSDLIDRNRNLGLEGKGRKGDPRPLQAPGSHWEYNDVRVNRLSLALLRRFRRPLPEVFAERIMDPIGASKDWSWHGYRTSRVEIDGRMIESVSGGTHWGGGMLIHAEDQARIGLLMLRRGEWNGRRILPESWIAESRASLRAEPGVWTVVVAEHRRRPLQERTGGQLLRHRRRRQPDLGGDRNRNWSRCCAGSTRPPWTPLFV